MAPALLISGIALVLLLTLAIARRRKLSWTQAVFNCFIVLLTLFGVGVLVIVTNLSYRVWDGVAVGISASAMNLQLKANAKVTSVPSSASSGPSALPEIQLAAPANADAASAAQSVVDKGADKSDKSGTEAIANAMAAISAVVAVVTLVLTLGVTWFVGQLQEVVKAREQFEKLSAAVAQEHDLARMGRETQDALLDAKHALYRYLAASKLVRNLGEEFPPWSIALEKLSSNDPEARFGAFGFLRILAPEELNQELLQELKPVEHYTHLCDTLTRARIKADTQSIERAATMDPEKGLWCLVFEPIERLRYELFLSKR